MPSGDIAESLPRRPSVESGMGDVGKLGDDSPEQQVGLTTDCSRIGLAEVTQSGGVALGERLFARMPLSARTFLGVFQDIWPEQ